MKTSQVMPQMPTLNELSIIMTTKKWEYCAEIQSKLKEFHSDLAENANLRLADNILKRTIRYSLNISPANIPPLEEILTLPACQEIQSLAQNCGWKFELNEAHLTFPNSFFVQPMYDLVLTRQLPKTKTLFIFQYYWNGHKMPARGKILIIAEDLPAAEELAGVGNTSPIAGEGYTGYRCEQHIPLDDDVNLSLIL